MKTLGTPRAFAKKSEVAALWAITWRSVVYLPAMVVVGFTWLVVALSLIVLPLAIAVSAFAHLWKEDLEFLTAWLALFILWRVFRLGRLWEEPPSVL